MRCASAFVALVLLAGTANVALAQEDHAMITPDQIKWGPAPDILPKGAQIAVLYGDPRKEGLFAFRLKVPAGYKVPPHSHPVIESVTVISGTFKLGMGETADPAKLQAFPAGSYFAFPPGTPHFAGADEETVVQISTNGPWGITYVNPKDDPRKTQ